MTQTEFHTSVSFARLGQWCGFRVSASTREELATKARAEDARLRADDGVGWITWGNVVRIDTEIQIPIAGLHSGDQLEAEIDWSMQEFARKALPADDMTFAELGG